MGGPSWTVHKQADACRADVRIDCPPDVSCNPPAPREIECPPGATEAASVTVVEKPDKTCAIVPRGCTSISCATQSTPCPTPYGERLTPRPQRLSAIWSVMRGQLPDTCNAYDDFECRVPPGQPAPPCNPPPPDRVVCPPSIGDQPMRIGKLPDGTCAIAPKPCDDTSCVKDAIACPAPIETP